ncbi:MAG: TRAP transporter small permease [Hyphomicrobiales bacterium]|nr:TRAP transporter small permease [Hyphomicrobiales bacterium]MCP5370810.1 TRAP transporter small permease [Hyphomicrobiales bacterium]
MTPSDWHLWIRRINRGVGLACGLALAAACAMIILEIVMRRVAFGLIGGTDEISGYVMAGVVSWAAGYALIERAHIRIDLLHRRLPVEGRAFLDVAALGALLATSVVVLVYGWKVLSKSLASHSTANTPLETPLWIPQTVWLAGWVWFALASAALLALTLWAVARRDWDAAAAIAGPESDAAPLVAAAEGSEPEARP